MLNYAAVLHYFLQIMAQKLIRISWKCCSKVYSKTKELYQQHCSTYEGGNAAEMKVSSQPPTPSNQSA
jgi:hypothetical protein